MARLGFEIMTDCPHSFDAKPRAANLQYAVYQIG